MNKTNFLIVGLFAFVLIVGFASNASAVSLVDYFKVKLGFMEEKPLESGSLPDLIVSNIWVENVVNDPYSPCVTCGPYNVTFYINVSNINEANTVNSSSTYFQYTGENLNEFAILSTDPIGGYSNYLLTWNAYLMPGEYVINASADLYNDVAESNEFNNGLIVDITIP